MRIGAENRTKLILMGVLLLGAIISVGRMFTMFGAKPPAQAAAPATATAGPASPGAPPGAVAGRQRRVASPRARQVQIAELTNSLDPTLRTDLLKLSEGTEYRGSGRNIFKPYEYTPEPIAPAINVNEPPPGPPPPPPIPLKFYGFASKQGEAKKIFLSQGEDVFAAGEGDIVNRRYRVVRINPSSVEMEDLLTNHRQTLPLQ